MVTKLAYIVATITVFVLFHGLATPKTAPRRVISPSPAHTAVNAKHCVKYPPYPNTIICGKRYMYHIQGGHKAFMADLMAPHDSLPPLYRAEDY